MDGTYFTGLPIAWLVHKIKLFTWKPKFHYLAHKNLPIYVVRQMYRLHTLTCSTPEIHLRLGLSLFSFHIFLQIICVSHIHYRI